MGHQMARAKAGNAKTLHRCRVVLNILFTQEERGISLGPGSIVGEREYAEMMDQKLASPDMFEDAGYADDAYPQIAEESETD